MNVGAIILAAGESRRMGRQKVLLPFAGATVIEHILAELRAAGIAEIIVVTGANPKPVEQQLAAANVAFAHNADYPQGMLSSIRTGLRAMPQSWTAFCLALGDQPAIHRDIVRRLLETYAHSPDAIVRPTHNNRGGHPVIIPRPFVDEILTDFDDTGLRGLFHRHPNRITEVPTDNDAVLRDIDYPEDYQRELRTRNK